MSRGRKVLVVGSGGREHALALRLLDSPSVGQVWVTPGNAGTEAHGGGALSNLSGEPLALARAHGVELVVIGPEAPLVSGLADELRRAGIAVYGPSAAAARLEGSKAYMKQFAVRHGLRTARHVTLSGEAELDRALAEFSSPPVVKADGLCAGKGVVVAESFDEARAAAREMLEGVAFGAAGQTVVLEERLVGQEVSVHAVCDGARALVLPAAQDHKRIFDDDQGPNTGGMGAYAPAPVVGAALGAKIEQEIVQRAVRGLAADGTPFVGTLFAGLMVTPEGEPVLLEFNVRFGDPETQVLMTLLDGDVGELLYGAATGRLDPSVVSVSSDHALCVVMAAPGYPGKLTTGTAITGLAAAAAVEGVQVHYAGVRREGEALLTAGGRVLGVTARGATLREAHERAYRAVSLIHFDGRRYRRDIGRRALAP